MGYSPDRHAAAVRRYVEFITPRLQDLAIRNRQQPGLARALVSLCVVDGIGICPNPGIEPDAAVPYLSSLRNDETAPTTLDKLTEPFYAAYVGYWFGRAPEQTTLSSGAVREANRSILSLTEEQMRQLGSGATVAYQLAATRHEVLRSAYPTRLPADFPSAESLASYDPRRATKR